jgi:hypothetical protein
VQAAQALLLAALVRADAMVSADVAPPAHDPDVVRLNTALDPSTAHLRDQLAVTLDLEWQVVAAFRPPPSAQLVALPPRDSAVSPAKPWYLVDPTTRQVIAGPSLDPLPANALYLQHPSFTEESDLVVLCDSQYTEDDQLPAAWFTTEHGTSDSEDEEDDYDDEEPPDADAVERQAELDALVRVYGTACFRKLAHVVAWCSSCGAAGQYCPSALAAG